MDEDDEDDEKSNKDHEDNDEEYDELMERLVIEEFGKCLSELIETAEKRN